MFGRKLKSIIKDLRQLGILDDDCIAKIDIDFLSGGSKKILVDKDEDTGEFEIYTEKPMSWVKEY